MNKISAAVLGLAVIGSAPVIAEEGHWYLGASAASYYLDSDRDLSRGDLESVTAGAQLGYLTSGGTAIEVGHQRDVGGEELEVIVFNIVKMLGEDDGFRPYVTMGVSHFDLDDSDIPGLEEDDTHQLHLGFGLSNMLNDNWELRGDLRALKVLSDNYIDGAVTVGINYHFVEPAPVAAPVQPAPAPEPVAEPEMRSITIRLNVEFETDKDVVRAVYGDELQAVAAAMKAHDDIELLLEGHTDSTGTDDYNQDLSARRAAAVKAKLAADYGISATRISTVGYGESRPLVENNTSEGRARNRRVVGEMTYSEVSE